MEGNAPTQETNDQETPCMGKHWCKRAQALGLGETGVEESVVSPGSYLSIGDDDVFHSPIAHHEHGTKRVSSGISASPEINDGVVEDREAIRHRRDSAPMLSTPADRVEPLLRGEGRTAAQECSCASEPPVDAASSVDNNVPTAPADPQAPVPSDPPSSPSAPKSPCVDPSAPKSPSQCASSPSSVKPSTGSDPTVADPSSNDPSSNDPSSNDPSSNDPSSNDPSSNDPSTSDGHTTDGPPESACVFQFPTPERPPAACPAGAPDSKGQPSDQCPEGHGQGWDPTSQPCPSSPSAANAQQPPPAPPPPDCTESGESAPSHDPIPPADPVDSAGVDQGQRPASTTARQQGRRRKSRDSPTSAGEGVGGKSAGNDRTRKDAPNRSMCVHIRGLPGSSTYQEIRDDIREKLGDSLPFEELYICYRPQKKATDAYIRLVDCRCADVIKKLKESFVEQDRVGRAKRWPVAGYDKYVHFYHLPLTFQPERLEGLISSLLPDTKFTLVKSTSNHESRLQDCMVDFDHPETARKAVETLHGHRDGDLTLWTSSTPTRRPGRAPADPTAAGLRDSDESLSSPAMPPSPDAMANGKPDTGRGVTAAVEKAVSTAGQDTPTFMLLPANVVSKLIGHKGETIDNVRKQSRCKIEIRSHDGVYFDSGYAVAVISTDNSPKPGKDDPPSDAEKSEGKAVNPARPPSAPDVSIAVRMILEHLHKDGELSGDSPPKKSNELELKLLVWSGLLGRKELGPRWRGKLASDCRLSRVSVKLGPDLTFGVLSAVARENTSPRKARKSAKSPDPDGKPPSSVPIQQQQPEETTESKQPESENPVVEKLVVQLPEVEPGPVKLTKPIEKLLKFHERVQRAVASVDMLNRSNFCDKHDSKDEPFTKKAAAILSRKYGGEPVAPSVKPRPAREYSSHYSPPSKGDYVKPERPVGSKIVVRVPKKMTGRIVGHGGRKIYQLQKRSNTRISVERNKLSTPNFEEVTIRAHSGTYGKRSNLLEALGEIVNIASHGSETYPGPQIEVFSSDRFSDNMQWVEHKYGSTITLSDSGTSFAVHSQKLAIAKAAVFEVAHSDSRDSHRYW